MEPSVIGMGSALLDLLAYVPDDWFATAGIEKCSYASIEADEMRRLRSLIPGESIRVPGGSAANTVVGCAQLGLRTGMVCMTGEDDDGELYRDCLASVGISRVSFKTNANVPTGTCLSFVTADSERTMRTFFGAAATLDLMHVSEADFAGYDCFHVEGYQLFSRDLFVHALKCARRAGCRISMDLAAPEVVASATDVLAELLSDYVDMVFANEAEAAAFCGDADEETGLAALAECCDVAAVKLGRRGALIREAGETVAVEAQLVDATDTTGAGDLWAAGFLSAYLSGRDLRGCGDLGAAVAAAVVQQTGAWIPTETWPRLRARFADSATADS